MRGRPLKKGVNSICSAILNPARRGPVSLVLSDSLSKYKKEGDLT